MTYSCCPDSIRRMLRLLRIQFAGGMWYHVMNRARRTQDSFQNKGLVKILAHRGLT